MRRELAAAIAIVLAGCAGELELKRIATPDDLEVLAGQREVGVSLVLDAVDVETIALPELRVLHEDFELILGPATKLVELPSLEGIRGYLKISSDRSRPTPVEVRMPALFYVGGPIAVESINGLELHTPALATCEGSLYFYDLTRTQLSFPRLSFFDAALNVKNVRQVNISLPAIETAESILLTSLDLTRVDLPNLLSQRPHSDTRISDLQTSTVSAPRLAMIPMGELTITGLSRSRVDLSSIEAVSTTLGGDHRHEPLIRSSTIRLGSYHGFPLDVSFENSDVELGSVSGDSVAIRAPGSRVRISGVRTLERLEVEDARLFEMPELEMVQGFWSKRSITQFPRLSRATWMRISGATGGLVLFPSLEKIGDALSIADSDVERVRFPALSSIGDDARNDACGGGLEVRSNPRLVELYFPVLSRVDGDLWMQLNPLLRSCDLRARFDVVDRGQSSCETLILDNDEVCR
jgi:hypothetical protein